MNELPQDPADWSALQQLLVQAMSLPAHERNAWVESLPATHHALREPLRRLLEVQAGIETRHFIDATLTAPEVLTPPATVLIGDLVGPYRLLQQIGDGGMGSVWLAERTDGTIKRKIALKLPRMVWARDLASRMARERDILGSLEHPNIARLYDAGVDQLGRPFLALEYVEGQRLDHYCDEHRLTVDGRIRLFLQVLDAVQYAHTNLVLHRDLKPGNILVNQRAEIRLLDFGIAKLIGDDTASSPADALSRSLSRAMTPRYASPEQVQQSRLTLASDVYSLGVMLYELLVGTTPLITHNGSRAELEIAITEGHLRTPSRAKIDPCTADLRQTTTRRLLRILRGELDAVLLKALARNATDRYPSAEALRADLVRWLEGHPVRAKPPSRLLALRKFIARNAWTVGIGTAAVTAVTTAAIIAILQAREARIESRRATATRDFLIGLFENANPELHGGREFTARDLLENGETSIGKSLGNEIETSADILQAMTNAWARLGDYKKMEALAAKRSSVIRKTENPSLIAAALLDEAQLAASLSNSKKLDQLLKELEILGDQKAISAEGKGVLSWLKGLQLLARGKPNDAVSFFESSLEMAQAAKDSVKSIDAMYGLMVSHFKGGRRGAAIENYRLALQATRNSDVSAGERIRRTFELLAVLYEAGEYKEGWDDMETLFRESELIFGRDSKSQYPLYLYWLNWAIKVNKQDIAEGVFLRLKRSKNFEEATASRISSIDWAMTYVRILSAVGNYREAAVTLKNIEILDIDTESKLYGAVLHAEILLKQKKYIQALIILEKPEWLTSEDDHWTGRKDWRIYKKYYTGVALYNLGRYAEAETLLLDAVETARSNFGAGHPRTAMVKMYYLIAHLSSTKNYFLDDLKTRELMLAVDALSSALPAESQQVAVAASLLNAVRSLDESKVKNAIFMLSHGDVFL
ncbi:MAG: serine/threonine protein kinase [Gammaproteobacteria bacterium]|nr:serine/threonine protein kinase [Gammaproteobacteria bacterium]